MFIAGVNYSLYQQCLRKRFDRLYNDSEFRAYCYIVGVASLLILFGISGQVYSDMNGIERRYDFEESVRNAIFQVVSIHTTTGFSNVSSENWPLYTQIILTGCMFVGGCGGSTGGGLKVIRIISLFRLMALDIEKAYRPHVVRPLVIGGKIVGHAKKQGLLIYLLMVLSLAFFGSLALAALEGSSTSDWVTIWTASLACINNIGPGFGGVGVVHHYNHFTDSSKLLLSFLMATGRLEVFTVVVLFMPRFWRRHG